MGYFFGFLFLVLAVLAALVYSATPHGGPTTVCGPITLFQHSFTIDADCRLISVGELIAAFFCFFVSVLSVVAARPRGRDRRR